MSSSRGELDRARLTKCRAAAEEKLSSAIANQKRLASLVTEKRTTAPAVRDDLGRLLTLSLHCRAALATLAPSVDRRTTEAIGNKVLVELRTITLLYAATMRDANDDGQAKARAAVLEQLKKTESHANEVAGLVPGAESASLGVALSKDVVDMLHRTALEWAENPAETSTEKAA
jgi:hypothetical protein